MVCSAQKVKVAVKSAKIGASSHVTNSILKTAAKWWFMQVRSHMSRLFDTPTPRASGYGRSLWEPRFTNRVPSPIRASKPSRESSRYPRDDRGDRDESGEVVTLLKELQEQVRSLQQQQGERAQQPR